MKRKENERSYNCEQPNISVNIDTLIRYIEVFLSTMGKETGVCSFTKRNEIARKQHFLLK